MRKDIMDARISGRISLRLLASVLALFVLIFLFACKGGGNLFGGGGQEFDSTVPVDSELRANPGEPRDNTPQVLEPEQPGAQVRSSDKAVLDYSNASQGYICALSYLDGIKVKVLVDAPDGNQYQYTILYAGEFITIPLSRGNGTYTVGIHENVYDNRYAPIFSQDVTVELNDEFGPFLYSNPYVNFTGADEAVALSQEVTVNATSEVEAVDQIYMYVVQNYSYDYDKAANVAPGYLPDNDDTIATKTGICFDFASLTAAMMRAQRLPTKLDIGYCGQAYHAWIEVYTKEKGWVRKKIEFRGEAWTRMDPTFDSAGRGTGDISKVIGDGTNYQPLFFY
ncbi:MAG: transglutaminase-like domain-containing protein [Coriobacteriales bacterium]|jgi:hypothetical protein|nr:transglutaminase-like domain-containing protein [Coriobacteriales bacterium]